MRTKPFLAAVSRDRAGFTLVEMIGVLSVIAILASLMVPRVLSAIDDSRCSNAAASCNGVRAAINEYFGRHGRLGGTNGVDIGIAVPGSVYEDWDFRCLVADGYLERPFVVSIGNRLVGSGAGGSRIRILNIMNNTADTAVASDPTSIDSGSYNRNGAGATNDVLGSWVVEACIEEVDNRDAISLNSRLDGPILGAALGANDEAGRVKYLLTTNGTAKVRVYLTHR